MSFHAKEILIYIHCVTGTLGIGRLAMQAESVIDHDTHFNFEASDIHMRYNSKVTANQITVISGDIHLEGEASFDVTGKLLFNLCLSQSTFTNWYIIFFNPNHTGFKSNKHLPPEYEILP